MSSDIREVRMSITERLGLLSATGLLLVGLAVAAADWSPERVETRVRQWQPTAQERAFERVGWADGLHHALALARRHRRPVFLFTLDGRMRSGRC
jgi:hypothetical protein